MLENWFYVIYKENKNRSGRYSIRIVSRQRGAYIDFKTHGSLERPEENKKYHRVAQSEHRVTQSCADIDLPGAWELPIGLAPEF